MRNSSQAWGSVAKMFHWLSVLLLIAVWVAVMVHDAAQKGTDVVTSIMLHKALGMSLGALVMARLIWRCFNITPTPLPAPAWQQKAASLVHGALYVVLLTLPISGLVMSQLAGKPVSWFGLFEVPQLLTVNKTLAGNIKELHEDLFAPLLALLTLSHIAAAIWHQWWRKDNLIKRMLP